MDNQGFHNRKQTDRRALSSDQCLVPNCRVRNEGSRVMLQLPSPTTIADTIPVRFDNVSGAPQSVKTGILKRQCLWSRDVMLYNNNSNI